MAVVQGKTGMVLIDASCSVIAEAGEVTQLQPFSDGLAAAKGKSGRWGFIDRTGKFVIPERFEQAGTFSEGLARVSIESLWGYIDRKGKFVIPAKYHKARDFWEGLAPVCVAPEGEKPPYQVAQLT